YKALWILGFFVGGSGGGGGSYGSGSGTGGSGSGPSNPFAGVETWFTENLVLVMVIAAFLAVLGVVMWILSVAAQGGLVHLVNEAEENRPVTLRDGWAVGFRYWGRTFMIGLVLGLPFVVLFVVLALLVGGSVLGLTATGSGEPFGPGTLAGLGGLGGLCCGLPIFFVLIFVAALVIGIISSLAIRYGVLQDVTFGQAIAKGWSDLRSKRGAFVFWLVMLIPGFVYSAVIGVVAAIFAVPAVLMIMADKIVSGAAILVILVFVLMLPGAVYGTFVSACWTVFFRRMNGLGIPAPAQQVPAYPDQSLPAPPAPYMPTPPAYEAPAPTAPPAYDPPAPTAFEPPAYEAPVSPAPPAPPAPEPPADA
ncbi:MAG: hypothetical protein FD129_1917, partial [bacterium]